MTQPEQEAREMLIKHIGINELSPTQMRVVGRAMVAFAARPTAGIDREVVARIIKGARLSAAFGREFRTGDGRLDDVDLDAADAILALFPTGANTAPVATPAKTGERGAVIEECAAIVEREIRSGYDGDDLTGHERRNFTLRHIAKAIRALSQSLPDAPIVSGEG